MRALLIDTENVTWSELQIKAFITEIEQFQINVIILNNVEQHQSLEDITIYAHHHIVPDGISKIYPDNIGYRLVQVLEKTWQSVFSTIRLTTQGHRGQVILCQQPILKVWFRKLTPQVKLLVVETKEWVIASLSAWNVYQIKQGHVVDAHDLLRAQIKPVMLLSHYRLYQGFEPYHWLSGRHRGALMKWPNDMDVYFDYPVSLLQTQYWDLKACPVAGILLTTAD